MTEGIRFARPGDRPALRQLWAETFGDEEALIDEFMGLWPCQKYAIIPDGAAVESVLWHIDVGALHAPHGVLPLSMVYALATKKESRGKGLASRLMKALPKDGGIICLTPADSGLFRWYKNLGCRSFFYCDRGIAVQNGSNSAAALPIGAAEYLRLREAWLKGRIHDMPNEKAVSWQKAIMAEGGFFRVDIDGVSCCAAVSTEDERLAVSELLAPPSLRAQVLDALMAHMGAPCARWRAPAEVDPVPLAMVTDGCSLQQTEGEKSPWLGFVFD